MADDRITYDGLEEFSEPAEGGFGYYGIVGHTEDGSKLECHICGQLFEGLAAHVTQKHRLSLTQYKSKFRLSNKNTLTGSLFRRKLIQASRRGRREHGEVLTDNLREAHKIRILENLKPGGKTHTTLETDLAHGTSPRQLISKLVQLKAEIGRVPYRKDFTERYGSKLAPVYRHFGKWSDFVAAAGLVSFTEVKRQRGSDEAILQQWTDFYLDYGRFPTTADCRNKVNGLLAMKTYNLKFGPIENLNKLVLRSLGYKEPAEE
jgi:hypothetical protein